MEKLVVQGEYDKKELKQCSQKEQSIWMWIVLLGCFLFQMLPYCVALNITNVFAGSDWVHWLKGNVTLMSLTFTVGALSAAFVGPSIAKMFSKKINMRFVYSIGVIVAMAGFFGSGINAFVPVAQRNNGIVCAILWISNILSQAGVMIFSGLGVNNLISKWWPDEKRGFALGIAFMGGSLGNIWMQQLVGALGQKFGNSPTWYESHQGVNGEQWATYLIMACIGLVGGLLIVLFTCRKPIPPVQEPALSKEDKKVIMSKCVGCDVAIKLNTSNADVKQPLEASPLVTQKYPVYWILAVGYLILQMGTIHASMNGMMIGAIFSRADNHDFLGGYNGIMSLGGTLFGIFCLIGNFGGGILNDKLGPNKSILLAGAGQVASIICLMLSVEIPALILVYFIIAGLSVYIYTSTPSYISGRLYGAGQSNNHMGILGIFIAVGFAIVNSITGVLTGDVSKNNITYMLGHPVHGNIQALIIFALVTMGFGTLVVVICSTMIMNKGIKGLIDYSPTKYSQIVFTKFSAKIKFAVARITLFGKDFRKEQKYQSKLASKEKSLNASAQKAKLDKDLAKINTTIDKSKVTLDKKIAKINTQIEKATNVAINESKQSAINAKADKLLAKYNAKYQEFASKSFKNEWAKYKAECDIVEKLNDTNALRTKLADEKAAKIAGLNKKIQVSQYVYQYNVGKQKEGEKLLETYYKNPYAHYELLVDKAVEVKLERKIENIHRVVKAKQNKFNKLLFLEQKLNINKDTKQN